MEIYLVGGAVRDELLGRPVTERDWVVVGSTPDEMLARGYRQVGRDFPVFLHPQTNDEYALARTERKTGPGHTGFVVHAGIEVTLEDDLIRRDLTINAMARDANGALIDPFHGNEDLTRRCLRHVSGAFTEDPLRVFRLARFAAQLPGFSVAQETISLVQEMAERNTFDELSAERVWVELHKALASAEPNQFLATLKDVHALVPWFAELALADRLPIIPVELDDPVQRYAVLAGLLGRQACTTLGTRLKAPNRYQHLGLLVARWGTLLAGWQRQPGRDVLRALNAMRAFKPDSLLASVLRVVETVAQVDLAELRQLVVAIDENVKPATLQAQGHEGAELGQALEQARLVRVIEYLG